MGDFQRRIDALSPEKRRLLEEALLKKVKTKPSAPTIARRRGTGPAPLSFAQQRLWFLEQWEPGTHTYNAALGVSLRGPIDVGSLSKAFDSIVERHEILRTTYEFVDGQPMQLVQPPSAGVMKFFDALKLPAEKRQQAVNRVIREGSRRPFDLAKDLMLRAFLVRTGEDEHTLLIASHHIACDGWSRDLLYRELSKWYRFHAGQTPLPLQPLEIQYADYACWQRDCFLGSKLEDELTHWRRQLSGCPPHTRLPSDHPRPPVQQHAGAHFFFDLPPDLATGLTALARRERSTMFIACLAAFHVLLFALSSEDDILVGTPIADRGRMELEPLIGFFVNTVIMRLRLDGNPSFQALIKRAKETALEAYAHHEMPFERLVEELRLPRDLSRNPLFQVNFRVHTASGLAFALPGVEARHLDLDLGASRFDLALELTTGPQGIRGFLEYNTALFELATIEQIASQFVILLKELTDQTGVPVTELASFQSIQQFAAALNAKREARVRSSSTLRRPVKLESNVAGGYSS